MPYQKQIRRFARDLSKKHTQDYTYIYILYIIHIYIYKYSQTLCPAVAKIVIRHFQNLHFVQAKRFLFSIFAPKNAFYPAATNEFEHVHFA